LDKQENLDEQGDLDEQEDQHCDQHERRQHREARVDHAFSKPASAVLSATAPASSFPSSRASPSSHPSSDAYIEQSILEPNAVVAKGYRPNVMPGFAATITKQQLADLIAFLARR